MSLIQLVSIFFTYSQNYLVEIDTNNKGENEFNLLMITIGTEHYYVQSQTEIIKLNLR